jgi:hypothetical protein
MQAASFIATATPELPPAVAIAKPPLCPLPAPLLATPAPGPPPGADEELGPALALLLEVVVAMLATAGGFEPPPQPAASRRRAARADALEVRPARLPGRRRQSTLGDLLVCIVSTLRSAGKRTPSKNSD